jgi:predicted metal-binding protein
MVHMLKWYEGMISRYATAVTAVAAAAAAELLAFFACGGCGGWLRQLATFQPTAMV